MSSGRNLFGRRSGNGRRTYKCSSCGRTARHGLPDVMPAGGISAIRLTGPKCICGKGVMDLWEPKKKNKGAGKLNKRFSGV